MIQDLKKCFMLENEKSDVYSINMESVKDALMYEEKETASFQ